MPQKSPVSDLLMSYIVLVKESHPLMMQQSISSEKTFQGPETDLQYLGDKINYLAYGAEFGIIKAAEDWCDQVVSIVHKVVGKRVQVRDDMVSRLCSRRKPLQDTDLLNFSWVLNHFDAHYHPIFDSSRV